MDRDRVIASATSSARTTFAIYLSILSYSSLSAIGLSDESVLLDSGVSVPFLDITIPASQFLIIIEYILIFLFLIMQVYIGRVAAVIDCCNIEYSSIDPWIVNLARYKQSDVFGWVQSLVVVITLWASLPAACGVIAFRVLKTQSLIAIIFCGSGLLLSMWISYVFACKYYKFEFKFNALNIVLSYVSICYIVWLVIYLAPAAASGRVSWATLDLENVSVVNRAESSKHLINSTLNGARLKGANFSGLNLTSSSFDYADMSRVDGNRVNITYGSMRSADLQNSEFSHANLSRSYLTGINGEGLRAGKANLSESCLRDADLKRASFAEANFSNSDLSNADLDATDFSGADLFGASLNGAYLNGTDFLGADLAFVNLDNIRYGYRPGDLVVSGDHALWRAGSSDEARVYLAGNTMVIKDCSPHRDCLGKLPEISRMTRALLVTLCQAESLFEVEPEFLKKALMIACPSKIESRLSPLGDSLMMKITEATIMPEDRGSPCLFTASGGNVGEPHYISFNSSTRLRDYGDSLAVWVDTQHRGVSITKDIVKRNP